MSFRVAATFACTLLCACLVGYGSAIAVSTPPTTDALGAGQLAPEGVFDDGVTQNSPTYAALDYGISASGDEIAAVTGSGSATVFTMPTGGWGTGAPSTSSVTVPASTVNTWSYGQATYAALSPDGNTLYVEFIGQSNNNETTLAPGHIYVYSRSGNSWTLADTLSSAGGYGFWTSGLTLSADGSTIVAGGVEATGASGTGRGSPEEPYEDLLVFRQVSGSWSGVSTEATETPALASEYDAPWQWSVSANGATIAVETSAGEGSASEDDIVYTNDGSAQISLAASGPAAVSGDGATIAVSDPGGGGGAGFADVFERPGSTWTSTGALGASARLSDAAAGTFGESLSVSSNGSAIYATLDPSAPEPGFNRAAFNGNGLDTFVKPSGGWATTTSPTYSWTPDTYPSTATADSLYSLVLSPDDSTLISLGVDCAGASSANNDDCTPGMFVLGSAGSSGGTTTTSSTGSTTTAGSTTTQTSPTPTQTQSTPTQTQSSTPSSTGTQPSTSTTPQTTCPQSVSANTNCSTGLGQPQPDGNTLNLPASCNYAASDGVSCTYNSGAYQVSSAACQSGCSITPGQAESAASAAVQSFMNSIGQGPLGQSRAQIPISATGRSSWVRALKKKGKPYRVTHVGSGRLSIPAGHSGVLKLALNASARAQLRRLHKLKLLVLVARMVAGHTTLVLKRQVTFSAPRKGKGNGNGNGKGKGKGKGKKPHAPLSRAAG